MAEPTWIWVGPASSLNLLEHLLDSATSLPWNQPKRAASPWFFVPKRSQVHGNFIVLPKIWSGSPVCLWLLFAHGLLSNLEGQKGVHRIPVSLPRVRVSPEKASGERWSMFLFACPPFRDDPRSQAKAKSPAERGGYFWVH